MDITGGQTTRIFDGDYDVVVFKVALVPTTGMI